MIACATRPASRQIESRSAVIGRREPLTARKTTFSRLLSS
jgi:hypothetical protein